MAVVHILRNEQFVTIECYSCGVVFGVSANLQQNWRETKQSFYCPNGHSQSYTVSEVERVRREMQAKLDAATRQIEATKRELEWEHVRVNDKARQLSAAKGQMTKLRKRVGNGVCPCCQRTFSQLSRHMAAKHPEFQQPEADESSN